MAELEFHYNWNFNRGGLPSWHRRAVDFREGRIGCVRADRTHVWIVATEPAILEREHGRPHAGVAAHPVLGVHAYANRVRIAEDQIRSRDRLRDRSIADAVGVGKRVADVIGDDLPVVSRYCVEDRGRRRLSRSLTPSQRPEKAQRGCGPAHACYGRFLRFGSTRPAAMRPSVSRWSPSSCRYTVQRSGS